MRVSAAAQTETKHTKDAVATLVVENIFISVL
jgi:hypothetical protein